MPILTMPLNTHSVCQQESLYESPAMSAESQQSAAPPWLPSMTLGDWFSASSAHLYNIVNSSLTNSLYCHNITPQLLLLLMLYVGVFLFIKLKGNLTQCVQCAPHWAVWCQCRRKPQLQNVPGSGPFNKFSRKVFSVPPSVTRKKCPLSTDIWHNICWICVSALEVVAT